MAGAGVGQDEDSARAEQLLQKKEEKEEEKKILLMTPVGSFISSAHLELLALTSC